jgi:hypothetical protein
MARRKTQNAIYNADGTRFALTADKNSVVDFLKQFNALRFVQGSDSNGNLLFIGADDKPTTENTGSPYILARPRSGYTQYQNDDGYTDPISPESLSPQGVGKQMAKLIEVAHMHLASGGDEAIEMKNVLDGIFAFHNEVADTFVAEKKNQTAVQSALDVLIKANGGDVAAAQAKLAQFLGSKGIDSLTPTAQTPAATVVTAESVELAAEGEINEQVVDSDDENSMMEAVGETT